MGATIYQLTFFLNLKLAWSHQPKSRSVIARNSICSDLFWKFWNGVSLKATSGGRKGDHFVHNYIITFIAVLPPFSPPLRLPPKKWSRGGVVIVVFIREEEEMGLSYVLRHPIRFFYLHNHRSGNLGKTHTHALRWGEDRFKAFFCFSNGPIVYAILLS